MAWDGGWDGSTLHGAGRGNWSEPEDGERLSGALSRAREREGEEPIITNYRYTDGHVAKDRRQMSGPGKERLAWRSDM